jgi:3-isopropylmalate/(R)-2-methylmalate dehydratase small subunit
MTTLQGRIWKFGDNIDTDIIIPANRLVLPLDKMKDYAMSPIAPGFASQVVKGDIIVAGRNFGCGSSREQAPSVLNALGIQAIIAKSFARIFFRNAINLGLPVIECADIYNNVTQGMHLVISTVDGAIHVPKTGDTFKGTRLPEFLLDIMQAGGLIPYLKTQLKTK